MAAFADTQDLEKRWRSLSDSERDRASALLEDASVILAAEFNRLGHAIEDVDEDLLKMVCCNMVRRVMASGTGAELSQLGMTVGPFSQQQTFANPAANLYMSTDERRLLGLPKRRQRIGSIAFARYGA